MRTDGAPSDRVLLEHLLQHIVDRVAVVDPAVDPPVIVAASASHEEFFGRPTAGRVFAEHAPAEVRHMLYGLLEQVLQKGPVTSAGQWTEDGSVRSVGARWYPIEDDGHHFVVGYAFPGAGTSVVPPESASLEPLLDATMAERRRFAQHLHDDTVQVLAAVTMELAMLQRKAGPHAELIDGLRTALQAANGRLRSLIAKLDPVAVNGVRLVEALTDALSDEAAAAGVALRFEGAIDPPPPQPVVEALFWIAAEGVRNSIRHAQVDEVLVRVEQVEQGVTLQIIDHGVGFDPQRPARAGHYGLSSIRARARRLGGTAGVGSQEGLGTTVIAWIPTGGAPAGPFSGKGGEDVAAALRGLDADLHRVWTAAEFALVLGDRRGAVQRANPAAVALFGADITASSVASIEDRPLAAAIEAVRSGRAPEASGRTADHRHRYRAQRLATPGGPPWDWLLWLRPSVSSDEPVERS